MRRRPLVVTAVVALAVFVALAVAVLGRWTPLLGGVDVPLEDVVHRLARAHPVLPAVATALSAVGSPVAMDVVAAVIAIGLLVVRRVRAAVAVVAARLVELGVETGVKDLVARHRPRWPDPLATAHGFSFPSGHSAGSAVMAAVVVLLVGGVLAGPGPRWPRWPRAAVVTVTTCAALFAVAVACSRVVLGVHYPSDVVAGLALGLATAAAVGAIAGKETLMTGAARPAVPR